MEPEDITEANFKEFNTQDNFKEFEKMHSKNQKDNKGKKMMIDRKKIMQDRVGTLFYMPPEILSK